MKVKATVVLTHLECTPMPPSQWELDIVSLPADKHFGIQIGLTIYSTPVIRIPPEPGPAGLSMRLANICLDRIKVFSQPFRPYDGTEAGEVCL